MQRPEIHGICDTTCGPNIGGRSLPTRRWCFRMTTLNPGVARTAAGLIAGVFVALSVPLPPGPAFALASSLLGGAVAGVFARGKGPLVGCVIGMATPALVLLLVPRMVSFYRPSLTIPALIAEWYSREPAAVVALAGCPFAGLFGGWLSWQCLRMLAKKRAARHKENRT